VDKVATPFDPAFAARDGSSHLTRRWIFTALGYAFAAAGLVWVLHDFHPSRFRELIAGLDPKWPKWIVLALVCDVMSYVCQGIRWRLLLRPLGNLSILRATQAVYAGLFTNEILPMRVGEVVRGFLASRWTGASFTSVIPSMIIERLLDGIWLALGVGLTAAIVPLPRNLVRDAAVPGIIVMAGIAILFLVLRRRTKLINTGSLYLPLFWSLVLLTLQAFSFWFVMIAAGLHLSLVVGVAVFLIVHLGTAIPNAPANIGSYQFFTVIGLTLFGVEKSLATGFSLVVFAILTLPLLLLGSLAVATCGASLGEIWRRHAVE
jgi:uncharacterized membrane protein YbhN (UPF0104 family)